MMPSSATANQLAPGAAAAGAFPAALLIEHGATS
jgi:hypothetical protein